MAPKFCKMMELMVTRGVLNKLNYSTWISTKPNHKNFCSGAFPDWLEINLTEDCNARCSWCIEKNGYHPKEKAPWWIIAEQALKKHNAQNIILLGGEPTLYAELKQFINVLHKAGRNVWITSNGSLIDQRFAKDTLRGITGINISLHHYDMLRNETITGIKIDVKELREGIKQLHNSHITVRLNCNCIKNNIDNIGEFLRYIEFSKSMSVDRIRFAELRNEENSFVDLAKLFGYEYGLNDDPFTMGCTADAVINDMPVNFRQMCGLQTSKRIRPVNPQQISKKVLYYDGIFYDGWQIRRKEENMNEMELVKLLEDVASGKVSTSYAALVVGKMLGRQGEIAGSKISSKKSETTSPANVGCQY